MRVIALLLALACGGFIWSLYADHDDAIPKSPHLGALDPPKANDRILIFAPHPDDETLGCGGYIQRAVAAGATVRVVLMTNGESSVSSIDKLREPAPERATGYEELGTIRQQESLMTLGTMGVPSSAVTFLGYPDHLVQDLWQPEHWLPTTPVFAPRLNTARSPYPNSMTPGAIYCGQSLLHDVEQVLLREKPTVVFTIHPNDIHPDHWATYVVTRYALCELAAQGQDFARQCRVYTYLIHRGAWPLPNTYEPDDHLLPPAPLLVRGEWKLLPLTPHERKTKDVGITLYPSQLARTRPFLRSFARTNELFAVIPEYAWPVGNEVKPTQIINDPAADLPKNCKYPMGDITRVTMSRHAGQLVLSIATRKPANAATHFFVFLSAGGAQPADRMLARYDWQGKRLTGTVFQHGAVTTTPPGWCNTTQRGAVATLSLPWPFVQKETAFCMARVLTYQNGHFADETGAVTFSITDEKALQAKEPPFPVQ